MRQELNFIQPVIDWEAGLFGRLAATLQNLPKKTKNAQNSKTQTSSSSPEAFQMYFEKFVKFVISELESNQKTYGSLHWWPFTKLCGLCDLPYDFIGKVETLSTDISYLDQTGKFGHELIPEFAHKFNQNSQKTEETAKLYFKQLSKETVVKLYTLYMDDFIIGGYDFPQDFIDLARN